LESDPEHRVSVAGDARQMDVSQSPLPASQPSARLYLLQRGQQLRATVATLSTVAALAAVVSSQQSTVVLTRRGDLVGDEWLTYQNNGNDYLALRTEGRPIYLATDGSAERLMRQGENAPEILVPLRTGAHTVRAQSLSRTGLALFGGALHIPVATQPLATSRAAVSLGIPRYVHPIALLGGDRVQWFVRWLDGAAAALGVALALIALRGRARRAAGALTLAGLWFVSETLFLAVVVSAVVAAAVWVVSRLVHGRRFVVAASALVALGALGFLAASRANDALGPSSAARRGPAAVATWRGRFAGGDDLAQDNDESRADGNEDGRRAYQSDRQAQAQQQQPPQFASMINRRVDNLLGNNDNNSLADGELLAGVLPVALPLPAYARTVTASRELVTRDRPFRPVLLYVTDWALVPCALLWLAALIFLCVLHRAALAGAVRRARARLNAPPAPDAPPGPDAEPAPGAPEQPVGA
jgi:hypothetical protein